MSTNGFADWQLLTLGELTENHDSMRVPVKESERRPGPYPYYGASGIVDYVDGFLFDGEYLLVAEDGENLRTRQTPVAFIATGKFWVNNHAHIVRGNEKANTRFLMYALAKADISGYLTGSTMPKLTQGNLNRIRLLTPPRPTQERIVEILGSLDDKIELNRRMNETLAAMARRLFKSWFVDFDPIHAKARLRRQHPDWDNARLSRAALPKLDPKIAELFSDAFEESTLGPIPKGWKAGAIGELAILDKSSVTPSSYPNELFDHYSIPAFDDGMNPAIESGDQIKSNKFVVTADCVLLTKLNPRIPRVWLPFPLSSRRSLCSTEFLVLRPKPKVSREFLFSLVSSRSFFEVYETMVTGTSGSHQRIRPEHLLSMEVAIPAEPVRVCFADAICNGCKHSETLRRESRSLINTRDRLLPELLSAELPVENLM